MSLPNYLFIGAAKSATTTFFDILKKHEDIFVPKFKEPHFFNIDENYFKGIDWYKKTYFTDIYNESIIIDNKNEKIHPAIYGTFGCCQSDYFDFQRMIRRDNFKLIQFLSKNSDYSSWLMNELSKFPYLFDELIYEKLDESIIKEKYTHLLSFLLTLSFVFFTNLINGFPFFSFKITISFKFIPFDIPVPKAFEKASFAANLFAKQFAGFFILLHFIISSLLNNFSKIFFFLNNF